MLDSGYVRGHLDEIEAMLAQRGTSVDLERLRELDQRRRGLIQQADGLKQERNQASERVSQIKRGGKGQAADPVAKPAQEAEVVNLMARARALGAEIAELEVQIREVE